MIKMISPEMQYGSFVLVFLTMGFGVIESKDLGACDNKPCKGADSPINCIVEGGVCVCKYDGYTLDDGHCIKYEDPCDIDPSPCLHGGSCVSLYTRLVLLQM